jgi:hypothetical protein
MKRYFILDEMDNIIDETDNRNDAESLYMALEKHKWNGESYRLIEVEIDGKLVDGVNILTYIYVNKVPKRLFLNQLRAVSDFVSEIPMSSLKYKEYEIVSKWFVR